MNTITTSHKPRKLRVQSKNFYLDDDVLTKENSISAEVFSPSETSFPVFNPDNGIKSVFDHDHDSDDVLSNGELKEIPSDLRRKRANSNCIKASSDETVGRVSKTDEYQKKYKTEICKNFQFKGFCQWGDLVD
jgi:hypothetical protein